MFPDIERLLTTDLQALVGVGHTGSQTPTDLESTLPFIRVKRGGGPSDLVSDYPIVDIDCFGATHDAASGLAEQVRQRLTRPAGVHGVDKASCDSGPSEAPWNADKPIRRFLATYTVTTRRTRRR